MPWTVRKSGDDYAVIVSDGPKKGKVVTTHPSREAALAHVKALYANTKEKY